MVRFGSVRPTCDDEFGLFAATSINSYGLEEDELFRILIYA